MDSAATPPVEYIDLTYGQALKYGEKLLQLGADLSWENWTLSNLLADRSEKWQLSLMAVAGNEPVGYAVASRKDEQTVHLHHLIVRQEWRNRQVGKLLLERLIGKTRETSASILTLKVHQSNTQAIAFYQKNHFSFCRLENDLVWMAFTIDLS